MKIGQTHFWINRKSNCYTFTSKFVLTILLAQSIFKQVLDALEHIHGKNLVYRNLEPYHVLISEIDEDGEICVVFFYSDLIYSNSI